MKFLFIIILCASTFLFAQGTQITGVIKYKNGSKVANATLLFKQKNEPNHIFSKTNENGFYTVTLNIKEEYSLEVFTLTKKYTIPFSSKNGYDIILSDEDKETIIEEVSLKYEMPMSVRGDTITYNAKSFTNNTEKTLKDVLKKMPGFDISKDGVVKNNGEVINTTLVEGNSFFGGNTKLAIENISADDIKGVEVIPNYNSNNIRKKAFNNTTTALNIKLKNKNKNIFFGNTKLGGDTQEYYSGHLNAFLFAKNKTFSSIIDINNVGSNTLTINDLLDITGGTNEMIYDVDGFFKNFDTGLIKFTLPNDFFSQAKQKFVAINPSVKNKKHSLNSVILYSRQNSLGIEDTENKSINGVYNEQQNIVKEIDYSKIYANIDYKYISNSNTEIRNIFKVDYGINHIDENEKLNVNNYNTSLLNTEKENNLTLSNTILFDKSLNSKDNFIGTYYFEYSNKNINESYTSSLPFLFTSFSNFSKNLYTLTPFLQEKKIDVKTSNVYSHTVNHKNKINFDLNINYNQTIFNSDFSDTNLFSNNIQHRLLETSFGASHIFTYKDFSLKTSLFLSNNTLSVSNLDEKNHTMFLVSPKIEAKYTWNNFHKISLIYTLNNGLTPVQQFSDNHIMKDFNILYKGGIEVPYQKANQKIKLYYYKHNNYYKYGYDFEFIYKYTDKNSINNPNYINNVQYLSSSLVKAPFRSYNTNIEAYKELFKLKFFTGIDYSFRNTYFFSNQKIYNNEEYNIFTKLGIETKWKSATNISAYCEFVKSNTKNELSVYNFRIKQYHLDFTTQLWEKLQIMINHKMPHNLYENSSNKMIIGDLFISYTPKDKNYELGFQINNIYNNAYIVSNSTDELFYTSSIVYTLPRICLFYLRFNI